jgi:hypothetical protein
MQNVKKSWKARGKRQATSLGANEKANVSQFEMENPVMQFAIRIGQLALTHIKRILTHLYNDELAPATHLTRLCLPHPGSCSVHTSAHSSYDPPNHLQVHAKSQSDFEGDLRAGIHTICVTP